MDSETKPIQLFENLLPLPKETFTKFHSEFVCEVFTYRTKIDNNIEIAFAVLQMGNTTGTATTDIKVHTKMFQ